MSNTPKPKNPQDRLPKNEDQQEIEGFELLTPPRLVKGSDQLRLVAKLQKLGIFNGEMQAKDVKFTELPMDDLADFIDYLEEKFAVEPEKFADFTRGGGGMERALLLAIAYANSLGEGASS